MMLLSRVKRLTVGMAGITETVYSSFLRTFSASPTPICRHSREGGNPLHSHTKRQFQVPACANGMTLRPLG